MVRQRALEGRATKPQGPTLPRRRRHSQRQNGDPPPIPIRRHPHLGNVLPDRSPKRLSSTRTVRSDELELIQVQIGRQRGLRLALYHVNIVLTEGIAVRLQPLLRLDYLLFKSLRRLHPTFSKGIAFFNQVNTLLDPDPPVTHRIEKLAQIEVRHRCRDRVVLGLLNKCLGIVKKHLLILEIFCESWDCAIGGFPLD